jgi:O-antigen/teichoic acid export membrane protein
MLVGVGLWLTVPVFVHLFGGSYHDLAQVLPWLALAVPGLTLRTTAGVILITKSLPWFRARFETVGLVIMVLAALILVPLFPFSGLPISLALAEWAMAVMEWSLLFGFFRFEKKLGE